MCALRYALRCIRCEERERRRFVARETEKEERRASNVLGFSWLALERKRVELVLGQGRQRGQQRKGRVLDRKVVLGGLVEIHFLQHLEDQDLLLKVDLVVNVVAVAVVDEGQVREEDASVKGGDGSGVRSGTRERERERERVTRAYRYGTAGGVQWRMNWR